MATDALGSNAATLNSLMGLFQKLTGSSSSTLEETTGGSQTEQTMLSQEAVAGLLKQLMEGTSGLANVSSGQKAAGLYNSTSRSLLTNDLLSRNATNLAAAAAPKVSTKAPSTRTSTATTPAVVSKGVGLGGIAAALAASPSARKKIGELFGSFSAGDKVPAPGYMSGMEAGLPEFNPGNIAGAAVDTFAGLSGSFNDATGAFIDAAGSSDYLFNFGLDAASAGADAWSAFDAADTYSTFEAMGSAGGDFAVPGIGSALNLLSGNNPEGQSGENLALSMIPGVGPILALANSLDVPIVSDIVDVGGDIVSDIGDSLGCYITTATCTSQGKADDCHELQVMRKFRDSYGAKYYPEEVAEYYSTAPAIVSAIAAREDAAVIWNGLYHDYIAPAVSAAQELNYPRAYEIYSALVAKAKELANGNI